MDRVGPPRTARLPALPWWRRSRSLFLAAFLLVVVAVGAAGLLDAIGHYRQAKAAVLTSHTETAAALAHATDALVGHYRRLAETLAAALSDGSVSRQRLLRAVRRTHPEIDGSLVLDPKARVVDADEASASLIGRDLADRTDYQAIVSGADTVVGNLLLSGASGLATVPVAAAWRGADGRLEGVVIIGVRAATIGRHLTLRLSGDAFPVVVDGEGRLVLHGAFPDLTWDQRDFSRVPIVLEALAGRASQSDSFSSPLTGRFRLGAMVPAPQLGWAVGVLQPVEAVLAPARRELWLALSTTALVLGLGVVLAIGLGVSLSRPIQALAGGVRALAEGDLTHRVAVRWRNEFGWLAEGFNQMAEALEAGRRQERKLNDELTLANDELRANAARLEENVADLEAARRRFHDLVQSVDAIVWEADAATWQFTFVSRRAETMLGYPLERWLNEPDFWAKLIHPDDREWAVESCLAATREGRDNDFEYRVVAADGRVLWLRDLVYLLKDAEGVVRRLRGLMVDITPQKQAEAALRESEARFRLLFANNPEPMWVYDRETLRFLEVNAAAVAQYGYSREEFLAMRLTDIRPEAEVPRLLALVTDERPDFRQSGGWRHRLKDGRLIEVEIVSHTLELDGRPAVLVVAQDVTERKQLEAQLRQAQRMEAVGKLAGGVAHDFNNVMTAITGYSELLSRAVGADSPLGRDVDEIKKAADRAVALTRQLLAFSRQQVLEPKVLDLNAVVTDIETMLRRVIGEDLNLVVVRAARLGRVKADPGQLEQVLLNLAVNARDAMPRGGQLTIETANVELDETYAQKHVGTRAGPYVMLCVTDTGCGMPPEVQAKIFEPFFTTKEQGKGTGLGLSTVYGIVKQSGGNIWVYSEPERGTTVKIYLPRVGEPLEPKARASARSKARGGAETVLLVEDDPGVRTFVRRVLGGAGYTVLEASGGEEALQVSADHPGRIALVLTDLVMPDTRGPELADRLVTSRPDLKVLYMSGYTDTALFRQQLFEPGTAFLHKPFTPAVLVRRVREVLDASHSA